MVKMGAFVLFTILKVFVLKFSYVMFLLFCILVLVKGDKQAAATDT